MIDNQTREIHRTNTETLNILAIDKNNWNNHQMDSEHKAIRMAKYLTYCRQEKEYLKTEGGSNLLQTYYYNWNRHTTDREKGTGHMADR